MNNKDFKSSYKQYIETIKPSQELIDSTIKLAQQREEALRTHKASTVKTTKLLSNLDFKRYSALACMIVFALFAVKLWKGLSNEEIPTLPKETTAQSTTVEDYQGSEEYTTVSNGVEYPELTSNVSHFESEMDYSNECTTHYEQYIDTLTAEPNTETTLSSSNLYSAPTDDTTHTSNDTTVTTVPNTTNTTTVRHPNGSSTTVNGDNIANGGSIHTAVATTTGDIPTNTTAKSTTIATTVTTTKTTKPTTTATTVTTTKTTKPTTTATTVTTTKTTKPTTTATTVTTTKNEPVLITSIPTDTTTQEAFKPETTLISEDNAIVPTVSTSQDTDMSADEEVFEPTNNNNSDVMVAITTNAETLWEETTVPANREPESEYVTTLPDIDGDDCATTEPVPVRTVCLVVKVVLSEDADGFYYDGTTYYDRIIDGFSFGQYIDAIVPLNTYNSRYDGYEYIIAIDQDGIAQDSQLSNYKVIPEINTNQYVAKLVSRERISVQVRDLDFNGDGVGAISDTEDMETLLSMISIA